MSLIGTLSYNLEGWVKIDFNHYNKQSQKSIGWQIRFSSEQWQVCYQTWIDTKGSIQERSHFSAPNATKYSQKSIKWKIWFSCGQCDKFAMTRGNWHFLHSCFPRIYKFRKIDTTSHILSLKVLTNFMLALLTGHWHKQILTNLNKK